jgi:hypothetical protein
MGKMLFHFGQRVKIFACPTQDKRIKIFMKKAALRTELALNYRNPSHSLSPLARWAYPIGFFRGLLKIFRALTRQI